MNAPLRPTEEQIAAAQLRIELDKKLGRETSEIVREIAAYRPTTRPTEHLRPLAEADQDDDMQDHPRFPEDLEQALGRDTVEAIARWRGATRTAAQAIAHNVDSLEVIEALARWRGAAQALEPEVLNNLGNALRDLGRQDEALNAYQEALSIYRRDRAKDVERSQEHLGADEPSAFE